MEMRARDGAGEMSGMKALATSGMKALAMELTTSGGEADFKM
jgi:hypothetical protein